MNKLVIDASIAAAWLLPDETSANAESVFESYPDTSFIIPFLWHMEIRNIVLVAVRRQRITPKEAVDRLDALSELAFEVDANSDWDSAYQLAETYSLSFYDSVYLELAIREKRLLATLDHNLGQAAKAEHCSAFHLSDDPSS